MATKFTNMRSIAKVYANALNLLTPEIDHHHQQVAYLAYNLADTLGIGEEQKYKIIIAALLHDIGIVIMPERSKDDERGPYTFRELVEPGLSLIGDMPRLKFVREIFNAEELPYEDKASSTAVDETGLLSSNVMASQVIDLSDKVSALLDPKAVALNQIEDICDTVSDYAGEEILPEVIEAFLKLSEKEYIWFELLHKPEVFLNYISDTNDVTIDEVIEYSKFMSRIIDFRSSYTTMHSAGVAASAVRLAEIMGMSEDECKQMMIAGYLHDVGKLKVPKAILDKSGKLTDEEFNIVKEYAYYTYLLLSGIDGFEQISLWASLHHEKLNGYGYPFQLSADDIPMGARIIAVADIFSAVAEIRSYRAGMNKEEVIATLRENVDSGAMSGYIVELMIANYDNIFEIRDKEARNEGARYYAAVVAAED